MLYENTELVSIKNYKPLIKVGADFVSGAADGMDPWSKSKGPGGGGSF
jgi:hypothetical protein